MPITQQAPGIDSIFETGNTQPQPELGEFTIPFCKEIMNLLGNTNLGDGKEGEDIGELFQEFFFNSDHELDIISLLYDQIKYSEEKVGHFFKVIFPSNEGKIISTDTYLSKLQYHFLKDFLSIKNPSPFSISCKALITLKQSDQKLYSEALDFIIQDIYERQGDDLQRYFSNTFFGIELSRTYIEFVPIIKDIENLIKITNPKHDVQTYLGNEIRLVRSMN